MTESCSFARRALHFVFKIGDRNKTIAFYRNILGMKVLRHEEFSEGCLASCNGPYDGKWSKSMIGYGPEDHHFVVELTYNYGISRYRLGNDFQGITIGSKSAVEAVKKQNYRHTISNSVLTICDPDGYPFHLISSDIPREDPVMKVSLSCSNLEKTIDFWCNILKMKIFEKTSAMVSLGYSETQTRIEFLQINDEIDHASGFGRIAFACPSVELKKIEDDVLKKAGKLHVLRSLVSLDTPGKATVQVVILQDPDFYEICFVGNEGFQELSQVDPQAECLLSQAIAVDNSVEWFSKRHGKKEET